MTIQDPPDVFSLPVVLCPSCDHGIDPHGTDPGGQCGVGMWNDELGINMICTCMWSPNDIAAVREQNARIEERKGFAGDLWSHIQPLVSWVAGMNMTVAPELKGDGDGH